MTKNLYQGQNPHHLNIILRFNFIKTFFQDVLTFKFLYVSAELADGKFKWKNVENALTALFSKLLAWDTASRCPHSVSRATTATMTGYSREYPRAICTFVLKVVYFPVANLGKTSEPEEPSEVVSA